MLTIRGGEMLTSQEAQTIAEYVRASVPGVSYNNIAITDNLFNHYKVGDESMDFDMEMNSRLALQNRLIEQVQTQAEQLLSPIFGMSALQITANVRLNFDRVVTETVEFAPPIPGEVDGIVRSISEIYENQRTPYIAEGPPGTDTNLGPPEYPYGTLDDGDEYRRAVIERNYEINETREVIEHERGRIESLSVAILIDSDSVEDDFSNEVRDLVSMGIGVSPAMIAVHMAPFAQHDGGLVEVYEAWEEFERQARQQALIEAIIMWAVVLLLGLAFVSLVRTFIRSVKPPPEPEPVLVDGVGTIDYIADDEVVDVTELEDLDLTAKSTSLEQIERFIDKDAGAVAQLLRNWLSDE